LLESALLVASCTSPSEKKAELEPQIARIVEAPKERVAGEKLLERKTVLAFYKARDGKPAFDSGSKISALREAIDAIAEDGLDPAHYHLARIDSLIAGSKNALGIDFDPNLELLLADAAAAMIDDAKYGRVRPASVDSTWNVDLRKDAPAVVEALERVAKAPSPAEAIESEKLDHFIYRGLKDELARLRIVEQAGGWRPIPAGATIKPRERGLRVALVRARLAATGELAAEYAAIDDSTVYDDSLVAAAKRFQDRHRLDADGRLGAGTIQAMNVPVEKRIDQVRVNLERARWVVAGLGSDFMLVNLPAFKAYLIRDGQKIWETRTQIGGEARQTPSFRAKMTYLVLNPTWTVPPTILKEDVFHGKAPPESMLVKKHLQVLDMKGNPVDPSTIDWRKANPDAFPYLLRQAPGDDNALGHVKFMFPNPYDIYLHDTPSRDLFTKQKRTFSSGCIRIENPIELARILLADDARWDSTRIDTTIAGGKTQTVGIKKAVPVLIVYWTVSVGTEGDIHYAPDVYKRDPTVLAALRKS
jgi:murein L,D-transpeptidase YcbB/YkuD